MIGGAVGGMGMVMMEETLIDHRYGRYINSNFADYHVPVHADVPPVEVLFVNKPDNIISPTDAKGIGEIALIGLLRHLPMQYIMQPENESGNCQLHRIN